MMTRRAFIRQVGVLGAGLFVNSLFLNAASWSESASIAAQTPEIEVSPAEDLMREHGMLERLLLIYEEVSRRLSMQDEVPPNVLAAAARINRNFVENYHEKLEENYLFPRLKKAGKQVALVDTLLAQHQAGRRLTDRILQAANPVSFKNPNDRQSLILTLNAYIRMYRPHASREDTILFPAFKAIVSAQEYDDLGEQFEDEEHRLFGKAGFEGMVGEVAELEKQLGIYDLNAFTPSA